jgi:hypothetical protein
LGKVVVGIGLPMAARPLPDLAAHVKEAVAVGRIPADGGGGAESPESPESPESRVPIPESPIPRHWPGSNRTGLLKGRSRRPCPRAPPFPTPVRRAGLPLEADRLGRSADGEEQFGDGDQASWPFVVTDARHGRMNPAPQRSR